MKKVKLIFTGGTISMRIDPETGAAVPALSGQEIVAGVPELSPIAQYEIIDFAKLPGPHMTPRLMLELSRLVKESLADPSIAGAVITHGTDTLEETAYFLDLILDSDKPVALVGAMKTSDLPSWDGPANLIAGVRTVISEQARGLGVVVTLSETINAASEVTKTHTEANDTFQSLDFGPLGIVDRDRVIIFRRPARRQHIETDQVDFNVDLLKMASGMDDRLIRYCVDSGAHGLVIDGLGRGNVPIDALPGVEYAISKNLPVVVVSRCPRGRVLDTYGYPGGGKHLRKLGVIYGGFLSGQKARIKLMLALGATRDVARIKEIFEAGMY